MADLLSPKSAPESQGFPETRVGSVAHIASPGSSLCNVRLVPACASTHVHTYAHRSCIYMPSCALPHTWVCDLLTRCMCSSVVQVYACLYPYPDSSHVCVLQRAQLTYTFLSAGVARAHELR